MASSTHDEMFATESEPFDGDATDSVQAESITCATSDPLLPSSPAHSPDQGDVFSHYNDFSDLLDLSDDEILFKPLQQIILQRFFLNAILITAFQITVVA